MRGTSRCCPTSRRSSFGRPGLLTLAFAGAACGGAPRAPALGAPDPELARATPVALPSPSRELTLDERALLVQDHLRRQAPDAQAQRWTRDPEWLRRVVAQRPVPRVVFVVNIPWDAATTDTLVAAIYAAPDPPGLRPGCAASGAQEPPAAIEYLCASGWPGDLELALFDALNAAPAGGSGLAGAARDVLRRFGLRLDGPPAHTVAELDLILSALPAPAPDADPAYTPIATLVAVAAVLADAVIRDGHGFQWATAAEAMTEHFGLSRTRGGQVELLRPLAFVRQAYVGRADAAATRYLELVREHTPAERRRR